MWFTDLPQTDTVKENENMKWSPVTRDTPDQTWRLGGAIITKWVSYIKLKILVGFVLSQRHTAEHVVEDKKEMENN